MIQNWTFNSISNTTSLGQPTSVYESGEIGVSAYECTYTAALQKVWTWDFNSNKMYSVTVLLLLFLKPKK